CADRDYLQMNQRRFDADFRSGTSARTDHAIERFVIFGPAIRISRAVFPYCPDKDFFRTQHLRPTRCRRQEMAITKGSIGVGGFFARKIRVTDIHAGIRPARPSYRLQMIESYRHPADHSEMICNSVKTVKLTTFRALPVACMKGSNCVVLTGNR